MKQQITEEQYLELTSKQKEKYMKFFQPQAEIHYVDVAGNTAVRYAAWGGDKHYGSLASIGQMIDFLGDGWWRRLFSWDYGSINCEYESENKELCDALWEAVKDVL